MRYRGDLGPVYESMSGQERALIALKCWKANKRADPGLVAEMSSPDAAEYNRLIGLMTELDERMARFAIFVSGRIETLNVRLACVLAFKAEELRLWDLASDLVPALSKLRPSNRVRQDIEARLVAELELNRKRRRRPPKRSRIALAERHRDELLRLCAATGGQLLAALAFAEEVGSEFGGEDPLQPAIRDSLERATRRLEDIRETIKRFIAEPPTVSVDEEILAAFRECLASPETEPPALGGTDGSTTVIHINLPDD